MPALDTLLLKQTLLDDTRRPVWHRFMDNFANSVTGRSQGRSNAAPYMDDPDRQVTGERLTTRMVRDLQMSHGYWVSPEMSALVTAAAEKMPDDEPVRVEDFPTQQGFLVIPGAVVHLDIRGLPVATSAVLWSIYGGKVWLTYLADKTHPSDRARTVDYVSDDSMSPREKREHREGWAELPLLTPWHITEQSLGQPVNQALLMGSIIPPESANQIRFSRGPDGSGVAMHFPTGFSPEQLKPHNEPEPVLRWMLACLRLMQQPLADVQDLGVPANLRKQFARSPVKMKQMHVSVINFRRKAGMHTSGTGREFSHRFLRRGHWRRQPFKPDGPGTAWDYRLVWIHPTLVGDPSKPLILREHVNALVR